MVMIMNIKKYDTGAVKKRLRSYRVYLCILIVVFISVFMARNNYIDNIKGEYQKENIENLGEIKPVN